MAASIVTCAHCGRKNRLRPQAEDVPRCGNCRNLLPWTVDADESSFDEQADRMVGAVPEPQLRQWLEPYLRAAQPA